MTTIKTIKLKRNPDSSTEGAPLAPQSVGEPRVAAAPAGTTPVGAPSSTGKNPLTVFAVLGLCAVLALVAVIGLQAAEISYFAAIPSVWPLK